MAELLLNYKEDIKAKNKNNTHFYTILPSTAKKTKAWSLLKHKANIEVRDIDEKAPPQLVHVSSTFFP